MDRPAEFRVNGEQVNLLNVALAAQPPVAPPVAGQQQQPQDCQILRSMNQKLQDLPQDKYRRPTLASVGSDKVSAGQGPRYRHWDGSILYENAWVSRKGEFRGADSNRQQEIITQVIEQVHMKGVRFLSLHKPDGIRRGLIRMSMDEIREKVRLSLTKGIGTIRDAPAGRTLELDHALDGLFPLPPPPPPPPVAAAAAAAAAAAVAPAKSLETVVAYCWNDERSKGSSLVAYDGGECWCENCCWYCCWCWCRDECGW